MNDTQLEQFKTTLADAFADLELADTFLNDGAQASAARVFRQAADKLDAAAKIKATALGYAS